MANFSRHGKELILSQVKQECEDAFIVIDLEDVEAKATEWQRQLPRVEPFYAVKCNPDSKIVKTLVNCGVNFDCASKREIEEVLKAGGNADQIVFANPCKVISHVKYAREVGVKLFTFDNEDELRKMKKYHPSAELVLRIVTDDSNAVCRLSNKFGAHLEVVPRLLRTAKLLGLNIVGISFHVGSGSEDANAYVKSIRNAADCFKIARNVGFDMTLLDIGGGFSGVRETKIVNGAPTDVTLSMVAESINPILDELFPESSGIRIIAEPGRYFVHSCAVTVASVIGRRVIHPNQSRPDNNSDASNDEDVGCTPIVEQDDELDAPFVVQEEVSSATEFMYYVNEGLYGSFNCVLYDHRTLYPKPLRKDFVREDLYLGETEEGDTYTSSVWGPTCDGLDCITGHHSLPLLEMGDYVFFEDSGAYSCAAGSTFNGFELIKRLYVNQDGEVTA